MSKKPDTFYRIYGSLATVCLIPLGNGMGVSHDADGYFYEYEDGDSYRGGKVVRETVYPSKHLAWEKVKSDLREQIAERERMLEAVILAWSKDEEVAKAPL